MLRFHKLTQISEAHCGPAVLAMLLDAIGITVNQEEITVAADAKYTIDEDGTRIDQLALATSRLAPQARFWYKYYASLEDIAYILERGYAVGVEWQGLFYESEDEEAEDEASNEDYGHFSIITYYDRDLESLVIVDPYKDFAHRDRIMPQDVFLRRWWDTNDVKDYRTGRVEKIKDTRLLFFVTPNTETFPYDRGFKVFGKI